MRQSGGQTFFLSFSTISSADHPYPQICWRPTAFSARCCCCCEETKQFSFCISSRSFVETVYKAPQILPNEVLNDIVDKYSSDYRRVYIERPRVRLDGVYIAVCHYMYLPVKE